ncbi:hypothetical protein [Clostridium sp.]|uniref:hypothetical protein n=1 Tax=Clostridium sp. TaxID=1506 RepID=UPI002637DF39|nr:hypothetical protein [uncultured Clostridium sp.]
MIKTISTQNEYELKVDFERKIVYEKFKGMFTKKAIANMQNDYKIKILPIFKGSKWSKYCDMITYNLSDSKNELGEFAQYCSDNGIVHAALIVENVVVKMQMNRIGKNIGVTPVVFTDETEAEDYLKTVGY